MAAGAMPGPGTEHGPCADPCAHTDCAATRTRVVLPCGLCSEAIGYETGYFNDEQYGLTHAACLYDEMDKR